VEGRPRASLAADHENALRAADLERLATAAFLIGRGKELERKRQVRRIT
jgi:hypothetical protein